MDSFGQLNSSTVERIHTLLNISHIKHQVKNYSARSIAEINRVARNVSATKYS